MKKSWKYRIIIFSITLSLSVFLSIITLFSVPLLMPIIATIPAIILAFIEPKLKEFEVKEKKGNRFKVYSKES